MKSLLLLLPFFLLSTFMNAQQDALHSSFMFNKMHYNPAYAGTQRVLHLSALYRKQWIGMEGAPQTATLSGHAGISKDRMGLGFSLSYDQIGFTNKVDLEGSYSYIIPLDKKSFLSFGIRASLSVMQVCWTDARPTDDYDYKIAQSNKTKALPNFGAGVFYQRKHWYAGISMPRFFENDIDFADQQTNGSVNPSLKQHLYVMGGLNFDLTEHVQIQPNLMMRYVVNAPFSMDINLSFLFLERIMAGVTYRINDSFDFLVQWKITPKFKVAFSYDISITKLQEYNAGSIEVMLEYAFLSRKENASNPRFF